MTVPHLLDIKATKTQWIITWNLAESENYDRFGREDGRTWMARLASVREPVERGSGRGYDEACGILVDIAEAYALSATKKQFQNELEKFMAGHLRRKALIQWLVKAGIWKDQ